MARSVGFRIMEIGFSMPVSAPRTGRNRHWSFISSDHGGAGLTGDPFSVHLCPDVPPFVGRVGVAEVAIGQTKQVGAAEFGIAGTAALSDFYKAKCAKFS
jgi:hypothetical protein